MRNIIAIITVFFAVTAYTQTYTPVAYDFQTTPSSFGASQTDGENDIPSPLTTMSANGYGLWCADGDNHWYLLGDSLAEYKTTSSGGPIPSGIISKGALVSSGTSPQYVKSTSNLAGNTRFVWPVIEYDSMSVVSNAYFVVKGFDDEKHTSIVNQKISIRFDSIPYAQNSKEVIHEPITNYPNVPMLFGGSYKPTPTVGNELDWRNWFAVASDSLYLYIVWEHYRLNWADYQLYVTVCTLSNGTVVNGYPKLVSSRSRRPSIACDVRSSASIPSFSIATIDWDWFNQRAWGVLYHYSINGNLVSDVVMLDTCRPNYPVINAKQVGVLRASERSKTAQTTAIYAIVNGDTNVNASTGDDLIVYTFPTIAPTLDLADYVDGIHVGSHPNPIGMGSCPVVNKPITAATNPYDGEPSPEFAEFHCLYQLEKTTPDGARYPLLICRWREQSTRKVLSTTLLPNPNAGAQLLGINQKGIYAYCQLSGNLHWFTRDLRHLDEPIEENTLLTYNNIIANGTSHAGTAGAYVMPERTLTLWTDPDFDNNALWLPSVTNGPAWHNGRITFDGETYLMIGSLYSPYQDSNGYERYDPFAAKLITFPNTEIIFSDVCDANQTLYITGGSSWDYYGAPSTASSQIRGGGELNISKSFFPGPFPLPLGTTIHPDWVFPDLTAKLKIHGGATFAIANTTSLFSGGGMIDCLFEQDITLSTSTTKSGSLRIHGSADLEGTEIVSHHDTSIAGSPSLIDIISIQPKLDASHFNQTCTPPDMQFKARDCNIYNTPSSGLARIVASGNTAQKNYRSILITETYGPTEYNPGLDGTLSSVIFDAARPVRPITIEDYDILDVKDKGIYIHRPATDTLSYSTITISGNNLTFGSTETTGIQLDNFSTQRSATFDKIFVEDNIIIGLEDSSSSETYGIYFLNSIGKVVGNSVTNLSIKDGIRLDNPEVEENRTFFCSNTITGVSRYGIYTEKWKGYGINNTASYSEIGHFIDGQVVGSPFVALSTFGHNNGPGIKLNSVVQVEFRGIQDGIYNLDGYNTVTHNNQNGDTTTGQIEMYPLSRMNIGVRADTPTTQFGYNNFIKSAPSDYYFYSPGPQNGFIGGGETGLLINYWSRSGDTTNYTIQNSDFHNVAHASNLPVIQSDTAFDKPTTACGDGYYSAMPKEQAPDTLSASDCAALREKGIVYGHTSRDRMAYDTLRFYIEQCYNEFDAVYTFSSITGSCYVLSQTEEYLWPSYKEWLLSVLYLRADNWYYCSDAIEIARASKYLDSGITDVRAAVSVAKYLLDSVDCGPLNKSMRDLIKDADWTSVNHWRDTVKDSSTSSPDTTTIYTLDELGLQLLRNFQSDVGDRDILAAGLIGELTVRPNPARSETQLQFSLTDPAVFRLDIFDALGRSIYSKPLGWQSSGDHTIDINLHAWAEGVYYARLSTLRGEVASIKIVKE